MKNLLDQINSPNDVKKLSENQLNQLAEELRAFILDIIAVKEGHLGASLGVIELTIALHYVFNTPDDVLVWDVGHQAYGHKILTGRKQVFDTNRQWQGICGFPKMSESPFDAFGTGHSSTSISAVLGMAVASVLQNNLHRKHIAVIGDASIVSGMSFEALNNLIQHKVNILIILNDNNMGIDPSVGAFRAYLQGLSQQKTDETFFSALQIEFLGSIDGHNFEEILSKLREAQQKFGVQLLHLRTIKGKGLEQAEKHQTIYHSPGKFHPKTGDLIQNAIPQTEKYQDVFGKTILELSKQNPNIVTITPAMLTGSSLTFMKAVFPEKTFDVGISEQHAVTFSAGLASNKAIIPYCVIYSTFLQRAYDQIIHDVALQRLRVVFCIDRAGLVGEDGATHQGIFDISFLRCVPNIVIFCPRNEIELQNILYTTQLPDWEYPIAIRYPRGRGHITHWEVPFEKILFQEAIKIKEGSKIAVLSIGTIAYEVQKAIELTQNPSDFAHYDIRFVKPLNEMLLHHIFSTYKTIITAEEGVKKGGFGSAIAEFAIEHRYKNDIYLIALPDEFIEHGSTEIQKQYAQIDALSIKKVLENASK